MNHYHYYSAASIEKRKLARERAIAWKVIKGTIKTFFVLGVASVFALIACYHILIYTIDQQIDQSNIRDCEGVKQLSEPREWAKLQDKCQHYYSTGEIDYMRKYHHELDN